MGHERVDLEQIPDRVSVRAWVRNSVSGHREMGYGRYGRYGWYVHRNGARGGGAWIVTDERAACTLIQRWMGDSSRWREISLR
jgi:hypothetical protein